MTYGQCGGFLVRKAWRGFVENVRQEDGILRNKDSSKMGKPKKEIKK